MGDEGDNHDKSPPREPPQPPSSGEDDSNGHHDDNEGGNQDAESTFDKEGGNHVSPESRDLDHTIRSKSHHMENTLNYDGLRNTQHKETKKISSNSDKIKDRKTMTNVKSITAADVINNNNDPDEKKSVLEVQISSSSNEDRTKIGNGLEKNKNTLSINTNTGHNSQISPCVSPPTCASPGSFKPTLIEYDGMNNCNSPDGQFLYHSGIGSVNNTLGSSMSGTSTDIPVDKENPMRCVECGEEFVNHFRYVIFLDPSYILSDYNTMI